MLLFCGSLLDAADMESDSVREGSDLGLALGLRGCCGCWKFWERGFFCTYTGLSRGPSKPAFQDLERPCPWCSGARLWLPDLSPV